MIKNLQIKRFKSLQDTHQISCKRVNVFIGEPDTGKTNILDALRFISCLAWGAEIKESLRLSQEIGVGDLFYRGFLNQPIVISLDSESVTVQPTNDGKALQIESSQGTNLIGLDFQGVILSRFQNIRCYQYQGTRGWSYFLNNLPAHVAVPSGQNLFHIARHHEKVYERLCALVGEAGYKLEIDAQRGTAFLVEVRKNDISRHSFDLLSDSVKRMFFYSAILLTTGNSVLVFDEPDVCAFPPYPKNLGEMIAGDATNQFFLTTHNPYFLSAIVEKTQKGDLALFVCNRNADGSTRIDSLTDSEIENVIKLGPDIFFNLDKFSRP